MSIEIKQEAQSQSKLQLCAAIFILTLASSISLAETIQTGETKLNPKVWAVQINVSDMDIAIEFYTEALGLEVAAREYYPQVVSLRTEGSHILLYNVKDSIAPRPIGSVTQINFQVADLESMRAKLEKMKVADLYEKPERFPLGYAIGFRDPFGNFLELVELDEQFGTVERTSLFNIHWPINDKETALEFYGKLGFNSYTDKYWPPVVPLVGEGMEFILYQVEEIVDLAYPNKPGIIVILEVDDIYARVKELEAEGFKFLYDKPQTHAPVGVFTAVRDPFGNVIELIQPVRTPFDDAKELSMDK